MSNLSKETRDRIEREAKYYLKYGQPKHKTLTEAKYAAYNEGALHEAERARPVIDISQEIVMLFDPVRRHVLIPADMILQLSKALAKYKEVGNG